MLDHPVLVYDLNVGGAFVNSPRPPEVGSILALTITLPGDGDLNVRAEAIYHHQHGFAVRFVDLDADAGARISRAVEAFKNQRRF